VVAFGEGVAEFPVRPARSHSEAEFSEMKAHGPKIADDLAEIICEARRNAVR
jgi:hypothetical protein